MKNDPAGHWMLTLVDVNQIALAKWEVPESVGTALHKLVELQVSSQSKASDIRRDGMLWGIASYYATVISVFRRYTINLAQQSSAEVCKAVGSSTAKGKGKAGVITWRAPEDWMPPTLKDCVIRLAGNYAHDPYSRALYLSECVRANVLPYSEEQYRMYCSCASTRRESDHLLRMGFRCTIQSPSSARGPCSVAYSK